MSTSFDDLFNTLYTDKQVDVLVTGATAESLRTSFIRRWSKLKQTYDDVGMLTDESRKLGVGMESLTIVRDGIEYIGSRFLLRQRKTTTTYELLPAINASSTTNKDN